MHRERIQNSLFGIDSGVQAPEDVFEHRLMEEELTLQLQLLNEQMPPATLFPEVEEPMAELPHLKDGTVEDIVKKEERILFFEELVEEGVVESLLFCGLIALAVLAPQIFSN